MKNDDNLFPEIMEMIKEKLCPQMDTYTFPPPVFVTMHGQFLAVNPDEGSLTAQFPVLESYLNPYGSMQGGMIAAAIDNTLGPLSVLMAPHSVTRHLEIKYRQPVTLETAQIIVTARLLERKKNYIFLEANVTNPDGQRLANAKAVHWIVQ